MAAASVDPFARQRELLDEWVEARRQAEIWNARAAALLAERIEVMDADVAAAPVHREAIRRSMVAEYSAAGRMAKGTVEQGFADARALRDEFPAVRASHAGGRVSTAHVREIIRASAPLRQAIDAGAAPAGTWALYEAAALEFAETEAPARTRTHVRELVAALVPQTVTERHRTAVAEQSVTVRELDDEMSLLQAIMPTYKAVAILDRLNAMARVQKQHPENRQPTLPSNVDADIEFEAARATALAAARADAAERERTAAAADAQGTTTGADTDTDTDARAEASTVPQAADDARAIIGTGDTYTIDPFDSLDPFDQSDPFDLPGAWEAYADAMDRIIATGPTVIRIPTETRGFDEIRTELLSDLLLTAHPGEIMGTGLEGIHARIQVTVAATTLVGADDHPAQLDGHGTLHPDIARTLAGKSTGWTRLFLDPAGLVTETDTYTPTEPMRRYLRARDQHCRFPGCRMPVHRSETDHTLDWSLGGPTRVDNLAHLCLTHHALKHPDIPDQHRWTARQLPDWTLEWTSPTGRTHLDRPPRRVMFAPSASFSPPGTEASEPKSTAPGPTSGPHDRWAIHGEAPPWEMGGA